MPANEDTDAFLDAVMQQDAPSLVHEIKLLRTELSGFRRDMSQLTLAISQINTRLDEVEDRISKLEDKTLTQAQSDNCDSLLKSVAELQHRLNESEQDNLMNDVEITGIPENSAENLTHIAMTLARKIGQQLDERDIVSAHRSGRRSLNNAPNISSRVRPIVVRLARRSVRDDLLRAARVHRGADTAGTDIGGEPRRFYVNEHLTSTNRRLFYMARQKGTEMKWRYIWTRAGRIYARCESNSQSFCIKSEEDIKQIFCRIAV
ncbi:uncharacterized protein LOC123695665 [Colias croceus]|uniref:uncharacterized protein LOC123695665 n=1 Tax=Colias crocea TaxID=72248 RepID=UPI001E27DEEE|nr:uncharacterized protein LOC123695665 [Colias croceus]